MPPEPFLPYGRQSIDEDDIAAVAAVLKANFLTGGPAVAAFEQTLCAVTGAAHAVACANGTAGLHLAALALRLEPGDKVIVPSLTFLATANAARYVGAEVVFADVDATTGLMGPDQFVEALNHAGPGVKAVFPVHLAGQCASLPTLFAMAREKGLALVEDAAHALGTLYEHDGAWRHVGSGTHSDMAMFSFHPVKTATMGEGGAITTGDAALAERLRLMRNHGMNRNPADWTCPDLGFDADGQPNPWYYEMAEPGFNYRATDIQCALGISQLAKLNRFVDARSRLVELYDQLLQPLAPLVAPLGRVAACRPGWHLHPVLIDFAQAGLSRRKVMTELSVRGIGTQVHYLPVHLQPYYQALYPGLDLPGARAYYDRVLSLPLFPDMNQSDVARTVQALHEVLAR